MIFVVDLPSNNRKKENTNRLYDYLLLKEGVTIDPHVIKFLALLGRSVEEESEFKHFMYMFFLLENAHENFIPEFF